MQNFKFMNQLDTRKSEYFEALKYGPVYTD